MFKLFFQMIENSILKSFIIRQHCSFFANTFYEFFSKFKMITMRAFRQIIIMCQFSIFL